MSTISTSIPVPVAGLGPSVDVSSMVGAKTVILTGTFRGSYVLYGSHDGSHFTPLLQFDAGGVEGIRRTFSGAVASVALFSFAQDPSGVTASVSGAGAPGENSFALFGVLTSGSKGPQAPYDLGTSNYQAGLNFIAVGGLRGKVMVEGSSDAVRWNPVGQWSVDPSGPGLLATPALELEPIETQDLIRWVRLNVLGDIDGSLTVTVGGSRVSSSSSLQTLAVTYDVGVSQADQTMVLKDAMGGGVVIDGSQAGFTGAFGLRVVAPMEMSSSILVGYNGVPATVFGSSCVVVGGGASAGQSPHLIGDAISIGTGAHCWGAGGDVCIGANSRLDYGFGYGGTVCIGQNARSLLDAAVVIGGGGAIFDNVSGYGGLVVGYAAYGSGYGTVSLGQTAVADAYEYALAAGFSAAAHADHSVAIGKQAVVVVAAVGAVSMGDEASSYGVADVAVGDGAVAGVGIEGGGGNVAVGGGSVSNTDLLAGDGAVSVGVNARSYGDHLVAVGDNVTVFGTSCVVVGGSSNVGTALVPMSYDVVVGCGSFVWGVETVVLGSRVTVGVDVDSMSGGCVAVGNKANIGSLADGSVAVGYEAEVDDTASNSVAIGFLSKASHQSATTVGYFSSAVDFSVAVGSIARAVGQSSVAVGSNANASDYGTVIVGCDTEVSSPNCVAVGCSMDVGNFTDLIVAVGAGIEISDNVIRSVVVGANSFVYGRDGVAVGCNSTAGAGGGLSYAGNIAVGYRSVANTDVLGGDNSIAVGYIARAYGDNNVVCGANSTVFGTGTVAVGGGITSGTASVSMSFNAVLGFGNVVWGEHSVLVGNAITTGNDVTLMSNGVVAIGDLVRVKSRCTQTVVVGYEATVGEVVPNAVVIGSQARAEDGTDSAIVIGASAVVNGSHGIALGSGAVAGANQMVVGSTTAGVNWFEVVSNLVGNPDLFRFVANLVSNGDTGFYLLRKATTSGAVELKQVTLSVPVAGKSYLQVDNS